MYDAIVYNLMRISRIYLSVFIAWISEVFLK